MQTLETMPTVQDAGQNLAQNTVCITVTFGLLGNCRKVSNSAVEVDADKSLIKVHKTLLDSAELDAIRKADGELRRYLYDICLPFDVGIYLLPNTLISTVETELRKYQEKRESLVERFLQAYPRLLADAELRLRGLFNPRDYPTATEMRRKFSFDWRYLSFGTPEALKGISREMFEQEREKASRRMAEASEEITAVMRQTLAGLVGHLRDRLAPGENGKPKILRDTAVTNLTDFLKTFDLRNVTNDSELANLVRECRDVMATVPEVDILRNSDSYRKKVQADMAIISADLDKLVQDKPMRKFRFEE